MLDRNNPSRAWKHFNKINSTKAQCIHCGLIIVRKKSSTSKLLSHITKHHSHHDREEVSYRPTLLSFDHLFSRDVTD